MIVVIIVEWIGYWLGGRFMRLCGVSCGYFWVERVEASATPLLPEPLVVVVVVAVVVVVFGCLQANLHMKEQ